MQKFFEFESVKSEMPNYITCSSGSQTVLCRAELLGSVKAFQGFRENLLK